MEAPGQPGIPPTWTSSDKNGVSTALGTSRVWITIGHGILNEIYWPRVDNPQVRDLGFIVADGQGFWSEVKRDSHYELVTPSPGVPAYTAIHRHERFTLTLEFCPDPSADVVLVRCTLDAPEHFKLYPLIAPHLGDTGQHNTAWVEVYHDELVLMAQHGADCLALCAYDSHIRPAFKRASAGYVGVSDGWRDFRENGRMIWSYPRAEDGNVALMGELETHQAILALGFGHTPQLAATLAISSLQFPFENSWTALINAWTAWQAQNQIPSRFDAGIVHEACISAAVLKVHQDRTVPGALVASLSIPWGQSRDDIGGYHLVWSRDLVESIGGLLAAGAVDDARRVLAYLIATQQPDGSWAQNQWLDGRPFWNGIQLDEAGLPILLAQALRERCALDGLDVGPVVRMAAGYLARHGPVTQQDRWEENAGLSPFTLAVEIAALVCAAGFLEEPARSYALELADAWNARIEDWTYVANTGLARRVGVAGYYVRIAPPEVASGASIVGSMIAIKNRPPAVADRPTEQIVSPGFLELVRLGLRRADDPKIRDSVRVVDATLKVDTPNGPTWHRYTDDGYGETPDGGPFNGVTGIGRGWPLLTGERGQYALAAGEDVEPYLRAMSRMTSDGGMIPEQVWDAPDIPERNLFMGCPTGSAMPLVWAHAEFLKLLASVELGHSIDRPRPVWERYHGIVPVVPWRTWRFDQQGPTLPAGKILRLEVLSPAYARWTIDNWRTSQDGFTRDTGLGVHVIDLPTDKLAAGTTLSFTFYWSDEERWENRNFTVQIVPRETDVPV